MLLTIKGRKSNRFKAEKILNYWRKGKRITILQLGMDSNHYEAISNEFAAIKAVGLDHLTNLNNSTPYGDMATKWNTKQIENYGHMLLYSTLINCIYKKPPLFSKNDIYIPNMS